MLFLLFGSLLVAWLGFLLGRVCLRGLGFREEPDTHTAEGTCLTGILAVALISQALHFFVALESGTAALALGVALVILTAVRRRDAVWALREAGAAARRAPWSAAAFSAFAILIAFTAARTCRVEDTVNYHAQVLRWTESASLVPGLALVAGPLGSSSLWFPVETVFSFAFLGRGPAPLANTAVFLIGAHGLFRAMGAGGGSRLVSQLSLAAFAPLVVLGFVYAGSQSPDLPAMVYGLMALLAASAAIESPEPRRMALALVLTAAALCWKLSALPLLLIVPPLVWEAWRARLGGGVRLWGCLAFVAAAGLAMLIWRAVVLSGYPLFPSTRLDVFPVDWKAPAWLASGQEVWIRAAARGVHVGNPHEIVTAPASVWIPVWVRSWSAIGTFFLPMLGAAMVLYLPSFLLPASRTWLAEAPRRAVVAVGAVAVASTAFWFWQAPDVRFGGGYLAALFGVVCLPWTWMLERRPATRQVVSAGVFAVAVLAVAQNFLMKDPVPPWCPPAYVKAHASRYHWLLPAPYPEATFTEERLSDGSINRVLASGGLVFYAPVPNSPLPIARFAVRRGPRLADGYRLDADQP